MCYNPAQKRLRIHIIIHGANTMLRQIIIIIQSLLFFSYRSFSSHFRFAILFFLAILLSLKYFIRFLNHQWFLTFNHKEYSKEKIIAQNIMISIIVFIRSGISIVSQLLNNHHIQYIAPHQISKIIHNRNNSLNKARNIPSRLSRASGFSWIFNQKWTHRATATIIHIKARNDIIKRVVSKLPLFYFYLVICQYFCSSSHYIWFSCII